MAHKCGFMDPLHLDIGGETLGTIMTNAWTAGRHHSKTPFVPHVPEAQYCKYSGAIAANLFGGGQGHVDTPVHVGATICHCSTFRRCTPANNFTYSRNNLPDTLPGLQLYTCAPGWYLFIGALALGFAAIVVAWTGCRRFCCKSKMGQFGTEFAYVDLLNPYFYKDLVITPSRGSSKKKKKRRGGAYDDPLMRDDDGNTPMRNVAGSFDVRDPETGRGGACDEMHAYPG